MMRRIAVTILCGMLAATSLGAWSQPPKEVITQQQVATALLGRNLTVSAEQVTLPSRVPINTLNPFLEVMSVSQTGTGVKLRCRDTRECLPFYAVIKGIDSKKLEKGLEPMPKAAVRLSPTSPGHEPWLVRSGERATLILEGQHLRIQMPVICLANGSTGKTIRVTTTDRKQVYRAQVAGAGLLKGGL